MNFDLIVRNANVRTMDPRRPFAREVGVIAGRIVTVDDIDDDATATEVIDADGQTVLPGFNDVHNHMAWYGMSLVELDLGSAKTLQELYDAVRHAGTQAAPGEWIVGSGYDQHVLGGHPHRDALDRAAGGRPVWLKHRSGHMCVVNTMLLDRLDLLGDELLPFSGGAIGRDSDGRPNGLLEERAQSLVQVLVLPRSVASLTDAIGRASTVYVSEGITSVTEAGIGGGWIGNSPIELAAYQSALEKGVLSTRTQLMVASDALHDLVHADGDLVDFGLDLGIRSGFGDDRISIGAMKIFIDGSLFGHTAALCSPYEQDAGNVGYLQQDAGDIVDTIVRAHRSGWQVAAHAIGDRAIDTVLDAFESAQRAHHRPGVRHRIEHCAVLSPRQLARMRTLNVIPVPQAQFIAERGDAIVEALGEERASWAYRHASFLDSGIPVPGSSDRPVAEGAPLRVMQAMVERRTESGRTFPGDERVAVLDAIRSYTVHSALAGMQEQHRGSISVGKFADLVFLEQDPVHVSTNSIGDIPVTMTLVAGVRANR